MAFATVLLVLAGCHASMYRDPWGQIPQSIAGEELVYHELRGPEAHSWALEVLAATDQPAAALTSATGFTFPDAKEYQSHVIRIAGVDGRDLIAPLIESVVGGAPTAQWEESIAGKNVVRYTIAEGMDRADALYAYAFDDVAISILARRPQEALEALRAMP